MTQTTNTVVEFLDIHFMSEHLYKLRGKCWRKTEPAAVCLGILQVKYFAL